MFKYWSMSRIKNLVKWLSTWKLQNLKGPNPSCPTFLLIFFQEALWRLDNRLVSMGKATMGMTGKFLFFFWDDGSQVPMVNSGGWHESVLDKKTYGKYHEWPWYRHGFVSLNHSQLCGQLSGTHGPRNQWDVADCLYWKCLDPTKMTEFQVLGGLRISR